MVGAGGGTVRRPALDLRHRRRAVGRPRGAWRDAALRMRNQRSTAMPFVFFDAAAPRRRDPCRVCAMHDHVCCANSALDDVRLLEMLASAVRAGDMSLAGR